MGRLQDKVIVVTGAAQGIGEGIAQACAQEGARLILVDKAQAIHQVGQSLGATALVVDLVRPDAGEIIAAFARDTFGRLDGLVNNAGRVDEADLLETDDALWHATMDLNLMAPFRLCRAVVPLMLEQGGGAIVNVSSIEATHVRPRHFPYVISKSGLNSLTRAIAVDFGRRGIRCNTLSPGSVRTPMFDEYVAAYPGLEQHLLGLNYAGRLGTPAELGQAAIYLLSDETPFLNGQDLVVDGARIAAT